MTEYERHSDRLEDEADDLQQRSEQLDEEISEVREDWKHKRADASVPGAVGEPDEGELPPPEPDETD